MPRRLRKDADVMSANSLAPTALFCVWLSNGLWHGANWTFIFYGMYYFVLIFIENILEEPLKKLTEKLHINMESISSEFSAQSSFFIIVVTGELFLQCGFA